MVELGLFIFTRIDNEALFDMSIKYFQYAIPFCLSNDIARAQIGLWIDFFHPY